MRISDAASGNSGSWIGTAQPEVGRACLGMISREMYRSDGRLAVENDDGRANPAMYDTLWIIVYQRGQAAIDRLPRTNGQVACLTKRRVPPSYLAMGLAPGGKGQDEKRLSIGTGDASIC